MVKSVWKRVRVPSPPHIFLSTILSFFLLFLSLSDSPILPMSIIHGALGFGGVGHIISGGLIFY